MVDENKIENENEQFVKKKNLDFIYLNRNYFMKISENSQFLEIISELDKEHLFFYLGFKLYSIFFSDYCDKKYTEVKIKDIKDIKNNKKNNKSWITNSFDQVILEPQVII